MNKNIIEIIGFIAAFLTTAGFLPQAIKTIKTKDIKALSLITYILFVIGVLTWLIYGILTNAMPIIVANSITFLLASVILAYIIIYRNKDSIHDNVVLQKEKNSCGAVSILNALNTLGIKHKEDEYSLIEKIGLKAGKGANNENIKETLKTFKEIKSLKAKYNGSYKDLKKAISKNKIVIVNYYNMFSDVGHYAVIYDITNEGIFFKDSSLGNLRLSKKNFIKRWHNNDKSEKGYFIELKK